MLQIRLLGQFDIRFAGKRIMIPSRAGQSLLAYIALTAGTAHRREKLAGIFWPDTSDENARKYLRQELWRIRKALAGQSGTTEYILADEFTITFNRNADYWLDAAQMERPDLDIQSLTANLSLYQGELLPGFFDDWIVLERERIQTIFETKMEQLLGQLVAAERWIAVQEQGERWLALGNTPEPAYRALMLAHGARGDMAKVSSIYQRCISDLEERLGLEPSAETRALYEGLLKGTHTPRASAIQQSGTITFLFTDIEESTNLLDTLGGQYATVLADHHEIMRAAIQKWNGHEVDTQGDAFFVTFARALDALQCAAEAQRNLSSHPWPHGKGPRVRMGLHTGEPLITSTGYVGMDVHRAARIGDAAHGGQVLLSQTMRELVIQDLPKGLSIRDLGEHRLKDLKFPTTIFQLVMEGLPFDFPPLRTKFTGTEPPTPGEPPFKGLQYFDETDSDLFFGREMLTAKIVRRLCESQFLSVIIGASGSGKSSVVRAGVIPSLKSGGTLIDGTTPPEGSVHWNVHTLTPTAHPLEALATELTRTLESVTATATLMDDLMKDPRSLSLFLARSKHQSHTLLVLDQFEELFTLCRDEFEREAFIDNLLMAIHSSNGDPGHEKLTVILTLRADFYAHLAQYPELRDAVAHQQEYIGPMTTEELRRAIEEPARRGHWVFEPGLVDLILRDVGDEPGALPLLSHALLETWKRRAGHTLTLKGYADAGGVRGAIAHTAETVYQNLSSEEQTIARNIFLRLTELGEGTEDTRRRTSFDELTSRAENVGKVREVLNVLADARLITLREESAEVAHEALIREWPTLREWLNQDREGLRLHRNITEAAQEWELLERDPGILYRGARLSQAREWAALHPNVLNNNEKTFLETSAQWEQQEQAEREAQRQRELEAARKLAETERRSASSLRARNRVITSIGVVALVLAILASTFGLSSNRNAQQALHAQATSQAEAQNRATAQANAVSERNLAEQQSLVASVRELSSAANVNLDVDPERSLLLALQAIRLSTNAGQPALLEAKVALHSAVQASRILMTLHGHNAEIMGVATSPDGSKIASIADDNTIKIWDAESGQELLSIPTGELNQNIARRLAFSPDSTRIAAGVGVDVKVWDVTTGKDVQTFIGHTAEVYSVKFSPDGMYIVSASADQTARIWNITTSEPVLKLDHPGEVTDVAFSPDGKWIAAAVGDRMSTGGTVKIWDAATGQELFDLPHTIEGVNALAFSPDGRMLLTGSNDTTWKLWDTSTGTLLRMGYGHGSLIEGVAFDPTGARFATASEDGVAKVWDVVTGREVATFVGHASGLLGVSFTADGNRLVTVSRDRTVKVWNASSTAGGEWLVLAGHTDRIMKAIYSPDGKWIATASLDNTVRIWDAVTGDIIRTFGGFSMGVWDVSFSPDGKRLVAVGTAEDGFAKVWDTNTGDELLTIPTSGERMIFSPDGTKLLTSEVNMESNGNVLTTSKIHILDSITGKDLLVVDTGVKAFLQTITFSRDGKRFAMGAEDGTVGVWDSETGNELLKQPSGNRVNKITFSPDGTWIVFSNSSDVHVVSIVSGEELFTLTGHSGPAFAVTFSPDGKLLATSSVDRTVKIWNVEDGFTSLPLTLYGHTAAIYTVDFSPDGSRIVTASRDGTARVYGIAIEDLIKLARSRLTRTLTIQECQQYLHMDVCPLAP